MLEKFADGVSDRAAYFKDIERIRQMDIAVLIASHDYDPLGYIANGDKEIEAVLECCIEAVK